MAQLLSVGSLTGIGLGVGLGVATATSRATHTAAVGGGAIGGDRTRIGGHRAVVRPTVPGAGLVPEEVTATRGVGPTGGEARGVRRAAGRESDLVVGELVAIHLCRLRMLERVAGQY